MNTAVLGLLAETSVHPGSGRSIGVIDLPVTRESATDYPFIPGSSLKGSLRDKAKSLTGSDLDRWFGTHTYAGDLLVSDCRLLLLPVRSLTGSMRWATCPSLIERLRRDLARAGLGTQISIPPVERNNVLASDEGVLLLEERQFTIAGSPPRDVTEIIHPLVFHEDTRNRLNRQLVVLNDEDFSWFARYGLSIQARNKLQGETKKSENLWYEETLPSDTIMYALIIARAPEGIEYVEHLFSCDNGPYLQVGGNESIGQGWFVVTVQASNTHGDKAGGDIR